LKRPSFAKSVVGLTGKFFGGNNCLPLCVPPIIRKIVYLIKCN
jgi:hypothetical protein